MFKDITNILNNLKEMEKYINKVSSNLLKNISNLFNRTVNMIYYDDDERNKEENFINEFKNLPLISSLYKNDEKY